MSDLPPMIYGIRHHGPGSARAVLAALERDQPDALAVEMPADLQSALQHLDDADLVPPISLVAYNPKDVRQALYYPLAKFSPEWVAMRWAAERGIPIHAIDLPAPMMLAVSALRRAGTGRFAQRTVSQVRIDPLGKLAMLAGYTDRERWWERTFELSLADANIFPAIKELIGALREQYPTAIDEECRLREMHMAKCLLAIEKDGAERIAVVCGAWHAPVLAKAERKKTARGYAAAKRGLKHPKLEHVWIPYTYERLRSGGGYGAGVPSPVWYGLLFDQPQQATEQYLTRMARELRELGHPASTAQVVDAVSLAHSLTSLRELELPGLDEVHEAALGTLAEGSTVRLQAVQQRVESLRTTGRVPTDFATLPLQRDLEARLKAVRLGKAYRDMEKVTKSFDLRKPTHLAASQLLCQLLLLEIPFGNRHEAATGAQGTFKESWTLHWEPQFALRLLTCHTLGTTIAGAAASALRERMDAESDLPALTAAVDLLILAGLFGELSEVTRRIRTVATETVDVWQVARALPALLRLGRYASLRLGETSYVASLITTLLPKLAAGLVEASSNVDDEVAYEGFTALKKLQPYLGMSPDASGSELWYSALRKVVAGRRTHPLLRGFALRSLVDADRVKFEDTDRWLQASLGRGVRLSESALFVEGFLYSSALVLLHQPQVLQLFDAWLISIEPAEFRSLLPALRRTFAQFPLAERRKLSSLLLTPATPVASPNQDSVATVFEPSSLGLSAKLVTALKGWLAPNPELVDEGYAEAAAPESSASTSSP